MDPSQGGDMYSKLLASYGGGMVGQPVTGVNGLPPGIEPGTQMAKRYRKDPSAYQGSFNPGATGQFDWSQVPQIANPYMNGRMGGPGMNRGQMISDMRSGGIRGQEMGGGRQMGAPQPASGMGGGFFPRMPWGGQQMERMIQPQPMPPQMLPGGPVGYF